MFKKMLLKALKSLSPEERVNVRKFLEGEEEKKPEEVAEPQSADEGKVDNNEILEGETEMAEENKDVQDVTTENAGDVVTEEVKEQTQEGQQQVQDFEGEGNGIPVEQLMTKDEFMERMSAFEAKFDAVIKENEDLKKENEDLRNKYENKDFGGLQKQGMIEKDKKANESFDEYAKNFM